MSSDSSHPQLPGSSRVYTRIRAPQPNNLGGPGGQKYFAQSETARKTSILSIHLFFFPLSEGLLGQLRKGDFNKEISKEMLGVATNNIL